MKHSILLIDDDQELCSLLKEYFTAEGFEVAMAHTGTEGLQLALKQNFDLILLDVMLPEMDGFEVLKALRVQKMTPVIMLTAKGDDFDRIFGLELGADDYIPKPFNHRELLARVKAITRRVDHYKQHSSNDTFTIHQLRLDVASRSATVNGEVLSLTGTEYEVLLLLVRTAGEVVDKQTISRQVLGRPLVPYDRSIDMHVSNVRKKIAALSEHTYIKTIRGAGYIFLKA
ncbi:MULTISPECIES: response regulator [Pseudoalteromonas]|uniref:Response regulator n=1 Tax=Pseudoalteromonas maricaloris TaxID=184924 RepID=A0A8I2KM75_9GAMM|nr:MULTISPECIES: response regulator [Pseudoalteromonas]KID36726.1 chemotaxis protein CheY [Pseudoalteromonas flavipulchra NCIMB 2033 = ATCC BAA-314]MBD0782393.1 response regulator [Pseudoalteromonas flavipulchra]MBE0373996.1 two-component system, OmpR family, response regulator CpxR [Pseudoalteromonas flavipulchra NCIMB 2033 = ATCC BAA-314]NLR22970.1 response regulator [Pseudoalteromonas maricaloris]RZG17414.1 response regulator [Pseudoalteromonas sp. CO342X]